MKNEHILHLPRREKKECIRDWNARGAKEPEVPKPTHPSGQLQPAIQLDNSSLEPPSRFAETPSSADPSECQQLQDQVAPLPVTVGLVRHQYRSRARSVEQVGALKAADAVRGTREKLAARRLALEKQRTASPSPSEEPVAAAPEPAAEDAAVDQSGERLGRLYLSAEDVARVATDAPYRDAVLRRVRQELASGHRVLLRAARAAGDPAAALALQLLCSQSLPLCACGQDVTPSAAGMEVVELELRPRLRLH